MIEAEFASALRDPAALIPATINIMHRSRFAIYRNNVVLSLTRALAERFPAVRRVVGDDFFDGAARLFVAKNPSTSRMIAFYGEGFADFLDNLPACAELPYLRDLARLEAARTHAYHAADAMALGPQALTALPADSLEGLRISLHPAVAVVQSVYPIVTIWAMNVEALPLAEITDWPAEAALISRPEFEVEVRALPPGGDVFLLKLAQSATLAEAVDAAQSAAPDFDLALNLAGLLNSGLVSQISTDKN